MTLTIYNELEQGSDAWLAARCGMLTASVIGKLITPKLQVADNDTSRGVIASLVAERITGLVEDVYVSADMERGTLDEPYARNVYAEHYDPVDEVGFMVREINGRKLGFSPDGLVGDDGIIEIKSRRQKVQLATILADQVPAENMAQIQTGLLVSGREWCDYVSYCGGMPLYVTRVHASTQWADVIVNALEHFENAATTALDTYNLLSGLMPPTVRIDHFEALELKL